MWLRAWLLHCSILRFAGFLRPSPGKKERLPMGFLVGGGGLFRIRGKRVTLEDTAAGMCSDLRCTPDCCF